MNGTDRSINCLPYSVSVENLTHFPPRKFPTFFKIWSSTFTFKFGLGSLRLEPQALAKFSFYPPYNQSGGINVALKTPSLHRKQTECGVKDW